MFNLRDFFKSFKSNIDPRRWICTIPAKNKDGDIEFYYLLYVSETGVRSVETSLKNGPESQFPAWRHALYFNVIIPFLQNGMGVRASICSSYDGKSRFVWTESRGPNAAEEWAEMKAEPTGNIVTAKSE